MGELIYGAEGVPIHISEHLLAHVKLVVATKLRRNESFLMSWRHPDGSGRSSVWLQPAIALRFIFDTVDEPRIDLDLLTRLATAAGSNGGLVLDVDVDDIFLLASAPTRSSHLERSRERVPQPAA